jgi:hypothetical protein
MTNWVDILKFHIETHQIQPEEFTTASVNDLLLNVPGFDSTDPTKEEIDTFISEHMVDLTNKIN